VASSLRDRSDRTASGRFRIFRYKVRRWPAEVILDVDEAVESP
jgi:hypothetical protein